MMSYPMASYNQLVRLVEDLHKENSHLRRELQDNSHHLSKLENETSDMKVVLRQLQSKLEQEAGTLSSSGRNDELDQLKELHMDLTNYYELKFQPYEVRTFPETMASHGEGDEEERLSIIGRAPSPLCPLSQKSSGEGAVHPGHLHLQESLEGRVTAQHLEELCKERCMLLCEIEKEEKEQLWYYSQLQNLSQKLAKLPRLDTFSIQVDLIRQQLQFEAQQLRSVMEKRFGTSDEMVQRTQIRVARLEQLEKELHDSQSSCPQVKKGLVEAQSTSKMSALEADSGNAGVLGAHGEAGSKVEMVFWILSMLASRDREEVSRTLLAMSSSPESCVAMRKSGCVLLLVQILHEGNGEAGGTGYSREARSRASAALHNIIYSQPDEGQARREMRVLHVLEQIRSHCENGWDWIEKNITAPSTNASKTTEIPEPVDPHICQALCTVMKLSFEEEYRRAMNELGALQAIAELMLLDHELYTKHNEPINMALRRYGGMALTNLTYGDVVNKATLCSKKRCLQAIVAQLGFDSEDLQQVVSSILRNLSWRADVNSKRTLRDAGSVSALMTCALQATRESTLKSVLSALWNLSAHSTENKVAICSVDGALGFLVSTLTYRCQTNSLAIIESGGGILRNVSSLIATRDDYRQTLREHNCLHTLLQHLRSHSLTIVSNACGTLWNLSARCPIDQELLWDLGAVSMLRNLIHSKHKIIAMGSSAALRNLLSNRPLKYKDTAVISPGSCMPFLYMRKQKALEAELNAKHLAETFDLIEKQSCKHQNINKPLRQVESLAKDYASDSGCFDDDEAPNVSTSLDTGTFSMLSTFLNSSNFLNKQEEPEQSSDTFPNDGKLSQIPDNEMTVVAEKLAKKITNTVAKIDKLVEDITMQTYSEDSFSLSSEDNYLDWKSGPDDPHEAQAISCSPCVLSQTSSFPQKECLSEAHDFMLLKTLSSSLANDSLHSDSASDGYCGSHDQIYDSARPKEQQRPNKLDLKVTHEELLSSEMQRVMSQNDLPERDLNPNRDGELPDSGSSGTEKSQEFLGTPATVSNKMSSDSSIPTVKLSPSYLHVPLIPSGAKFDVVKPSINIAAQTLQKQAWVPTVMTGGNGVKFSPICSTKSPTIGQLETLQKYSVENTPICFSRCSSLSSLSSGDEALDGQSQTENELESDSSLEIIEVEDISDERKDDGTFDHLSDSDLLVTDDKVCAGNSSASTEIPSTFKNDKFFKEIVSNLEDMTPSSSSDNYLHETPLVMSRCSSVSSLGSFESPSIASSIQSDPCSEIVSGTISPSDLPDSPGQTMPPSRSKTPCCAESSGPDAQAHRETESQWENSFCKLMEMADFKERFNLPSDLDTMIYFTVEKPVENFSCASSLSALPFHEHYVQKDVELRLNPLQDNDSGSSEKGVDMEEQDQYSEGNSDDDIEILKECINSAMPSRFKKVKPAVMSAISSHVLNMQTQKSLPMCMMLQNKTQMSALKYYKDKYHDGSYNYDDGATGNYSKNTHLRDQHQFLVRADGVKERKKNKSSKEPEDVEEKRIEELRTFSRFHKATKKMSPPHIITNQPNKTIRHLVPSQKLLMHSEEITKKAEEKILYQSPKIQKQGQNLSKSMSQLNIPLRKQKADVCPNHKTSALNYAHENRLSSKSLHQKQANEKAKSKERERKDENRLANMTRRKKHQLTKTSSVQNSNVKDKGLHYQSRKSGFQKIKQSLILEEAPPCYSLSSSLSSLSDSEFEEPCGNAQQTWKGNRLVTSNCKSQQNCHHFEDNSSASSVSMDSEDDLLFKCISSAMPQQKNKPTIRNRRVEKKNKQNNIKTANEAWDHENDMDSDEMCSEEDSDLNSVEWRAIQEEANTIITKLQASKSQESFTETESVLSFMSESSFTPKEKKVFKDDFMVNKPLDFAPCKPVPNLPVVFRGRTVTYMPKKETAPSQRPTPKKVTTTSKAPKNENLSQYRSRSLHRLSQSSDFAELSLPKRSSTPPARIPKSSSSGSSQSSTPCRQRPKRATFSTQITKQDQEKETSPTLDKFGNHTNTDQYSKSPIDRKTQKSPVRIPFMQNPSKRRTISPLVTNQSSTVSRINVQAAGKRIPPGNRLEIVRQGTTSNNSGFLRQLTFIKDSSIAQKRNSSSYSVPSLQHGSPRRAGSGPPTVFLCSSRCQELKKVAQGPRQFSSEQEGVCKNNKPLSRGMSATRNPTLKPSNRRTSSESPCRTQSAKPEPKKIPPRDENIKRYSSSPSIHLLSRVTSHSSLRSSSSDSSERAKSEKNANQMQKRAGSQKADRVTWRRIHDEEVPHILKSTLPSTALPLVQISEDAIQLSRKLPKITLASRKTSDATVQTEDCSAGKTNSSTSPTKRSDLGFSEETTDDRKASISIESTSQDQESIVSVKTYSTFKSMESHSSGVGHFRQSSPSRAVRVTPFNYIPRPVVTCSPQSQCPSLTIPEKSSEKV